MKANAVRFILLLLIVVVSMTPTHAGRASTPGYRILNVDFCSDWELFQSSGYDEYRRACFHAIWEKHNDATDIYVYVECLEGPGTCEDGEKRAWCQTDNPGPDAIQVQNPNRMVVELTPADCDSSFNSVGTQLSAESNGLENTRIDYETMHIRWVNDSGQHCMQKMIGGREVNRSADFEAVIEGMYVAGPGYIKTVVTNRLIENCGE